MSYARSHLRSLTYAAFGELLDVLTRRVVSACAERSLEIAIVAPILRSGGITGCHLASKLRVADVVPLQYKHTYDERAPLRRQFVMPSLADEPRAGAILLADTNTVTGEIATASSAELRGRWPARPIVFASVTLDVSVEHVPHVDLLISALRTNERRTLSHESALSRGVSKDIYIFPWENLDEQWAELIASVREERL